MLVVHRCRFMPPSNKDVQFVKIAVGSAFAQRDSGAEMLKVQRMVRSLIFHVLLQNKGCLHIPTLCDCVFERRAPIQV